LGGVPISLGVCVERGITGVPGIFCTSLIGGIFIFASMFAPLAPGMFGLAAPGIIFGLAAPGIMFPVPEGIIGLAPGIFGPGIMFGLAAPGIFGPGIMFPVPEGIAGLAPGMFGPGIMFVPEGIIGLAGMFGPGIMFPVPEGIIGLAGMFIVGIAISLFVPAILLGAMLAICVPKVLGMLKRFLFSR
jgi:hypothetical protein